MWVFLLTQSHPLGPKHRCSVIAVVMYPIVSAAHPHHGLSVEVRGRLWGLASLSSPWVLGILLRLPVPWNKWFYPQSQLTGSSLPVNNQQNKTKPQPEINFWRARLWARRSETVPSQLPSQPWSSGLSPSAGRPPRRRPGCSSLLEGPEKGGGMGVG